MKLALLLAGALIPGPIPAIEQIGDTIKLTAAEMVRCAVAGPCLVIPQGDLEADLAKWMKRAFDAGRSEACRGT